MNRKQRMFARIATVSGLAVVAGCNTLATDPLSPPHVRRAACTTQHVVSGAEQRLSPDYQEWIAEVRHFGHDTASEFRDEYDRNNRWPEPYTTLSFHAVREPLSIQAENARLQMLSLWEYHFESGTGKLTVMGRNRLKDILDQAESLGHVVYVHQSTVSVETESRIKEVRREIATLVGDDAAFHVTEAKATPSVLSGGEAQRAMQLLTAPPKSTSSTGSSTTTGGGSAASGGSTGSGGGK